MKGRVKNKNKNRLQAMMYARYDHAMIYLNSKVYVFGGINGMFGGAFRECESYHIQKTKWKEINKLNIRRAKASCCNFGIDIIYIFGGYNSQPIDSIEK